MASKKKLLQAAAGSAGGAGLDVDEVFSTYLYDGTGSAQTITNGIDLSGEGGMVWIKGRMEGSFSHYWFDTERGVTKYIRSNETNEEGTDSNTLTAFNSNGFTVGSANATNYNTGDFVSWTFRKAPKFFDVVTYTGNGTTQQVIAHNLGSVPGMIIFKKTSASENWAVYHRRANGGTDPEDYRLELNETFAESNRDGFLNDTAPTATHFTVGGGALSNTNGATYVAYLFAHHNNDGEFGPDSDQDIIKCGSYTGTGSAGLEVDIGFEPQWMFIKRADGASSWELHDNMRGWPFGNTNGNKYVNINTNAADQGSDTFYPTSTGVVISQNSFFPNVNASGGNYIYMAIRRGPLAPPDDATKVFSMDTQGSSAPYFDSNHIVDMALVKALTTTGDWYNYARFMDEKYLATNTTAAEANASEAGFDFMDGHIDANWGSGFPRSSMWKRAPGYFDVCAWTGNDTAGRTVAHNLGVVPEMIWVKNRSDSVEWAVYHKDLSQGYFLKLNVSDAATGAYVFGADSSNDAQSATNIILSSSNMVNELNKNYIGYLFATVAGVSKVGSFTISGSNIDVDCGFSNGARFVIIKRTDSTGNWFQFDTLRGFSSGNDSTIFLNTTDSEQLADYIDPLSSGFSIESSSWANGNYIFYAIA